MRLQQLKYLRAQKHDGMNVLGISSQLNRCRQQGHQEPVSRFRVVPTLVQLVYVDGQCMTPQRFLKYRQQLEQLVHLEQLAELTRTLQAQFALDRTDSALNSRYSTQICNELIEQR